MIATELDKRCPDCDRRGFVKVIEEGVFGLTLKRQIRCSNCGWSYVLRKDENAWEALHDE